MRRVGKTTTLRWLLDQIPSQNKIFLDLERRDLGSIFWESNYEFVLNDSRNQGLDLTKPMTVALDEIQYAPNLPSVVASSIYMTIMGSSSWLTGSSSYYL